MPVSQTEIFSAHGDVSASMAIITIVKSDVFLFMPTGSRWCSTPSHHGGDHGHHHERCPQWAACAT